ncbi:MAG: isoleucine--tRNA ligase [Candidatus Micrarchaeota archaeon]|nr:isoleucine--tRNA ligase [Candidatus Micrarchaeota archaeon]
MYDHKRIEGEVEQFWKEKEVYKKVKEASQKQEKEFIFIDGPPFVTGDIHPGTAWNKSIKDAYLRYFRMRGFNVWDQPGFDTHGLPIEVKVEKKLGITNKHEIEEKYGLERFIQECRAFVDEYIKIMTKQLKSFHVWMDWDNPYITYKNEYIVRSWKTIKKAWEKGLLKEGNYVVPYCERCETTLANYELEYKELEDPSIFVKFPVDENTYLLIWTTTPWTLAGNLAVMAHPKETYVKIKRDGEYLILAKKRLEALKDILGEFEVVEEFPGEKLEGLAYKHPFQDLIKLEYPRKVILSEEFVSMEDGTGLVHSAPGHGEEDFKAARKYNIPVISVVGDKGEYLEEAGVFAGKNARKSNPEIINILKERGLLLHEGKIRHRYPTCWRCKTPLIYRATHQWFITITDVKDRMIEEAKSAKWVPKFAEKRFLNFLKDAPDWCISRQRYWGIPLPIWKCKNGHVKIIDEAPEGVEDLHRPYIDKVVFKCEECGEEMHRVKDVLDVWFDSGNAVWASTGKDIQADFITEGQDQIRGWFYSLLGSGIIYYDKIPYKAVAMHGFFLDENGVKMSKSVGNFVPVDEIIDRMGADAFRLFGLSNTLWEDLKFSWRDVENAKKDLNIVLNLVSYLKNEYKPWEIPPMEPSFVEDQWILSKMNSLKKEYQEAFERFELFDGVRKLRKFVEDDLSRFYMKLAKNRVKIGDKMPLKVLYEVMKEVLIMLAPVAPAIAEHAYQQFYRKYEKELSIHLLPITKHGKIDKELEEEMERVRDMIADGLSVRQEHKLSLRMPLAKAHIPAKYERYKDVVKQMLNVKEVSVEQPPSKDVEKEDYYLYLDKEITPELEKEWLLNEVLRRIQFMRKKANLQSEQYIKLEVDGELAEIVKEFEDVIKERARVKEIAYGVEEGEEFDIKGKKIRIKLEVIPESGGD